MAPNNDSGHFAVLFVDDEEKARKYFARALASNADVYTASHVAEALTVLEEHGPSIAVLVTDQRMPGGSGTELLRQVRARWPRIVRLLTTAYTDLDEAIEAVNSGEIFRYITKPWDIEALRAEVRQAMAYFELRRERDLLLDEKLNTRQRFIYLQRARDLIIMCGSFPHLRNALAAVTAYLSQVGTLPPADERAGGEDYQGAEQFGPWMLERREIQRSLQLAGEVLAQTAGPQPQTQFSDTVPLAELLGAVGEETGLSVADAANWPPIRADALLLHRMFSTLVQSLSKPVTARGASCDIDGQAGVRVSLSGASAQVTGDPDRQARLLSAYLIAYHHGGRLTLEVTGGDGAGAVVELPEDAGAAPAVVAEEDWVDRALAPLELLD